MSRFFDNELLTTAWMNDRSTSSPMSSICPSLSADKKSLIGISVAASTAAVSTAASSSKTCPPVRAKTLKPLSAGGLCDAVIITPTPHFSSRTAKDNSGEARCDRNRNVLMP